MSKLAIEIERKPGDTRQGVQIEAIGSSMEIIPMLAIAVKETAAQLLAAIDPQEDMDAVGDGISFLLHVAMTDAKSAARKALAERRQEEAESCGQ